jgi:Biotin-lipoyl like
VIDEFGIATYQSPKIVRQLFGDRDRCAIEQDRHDRYPTSEPFAHLDAHKVIWALKPSAARLRVNRIGPPSPDQRQHDVALLDPAFQKLDEINADRNAINVHKYMIAWQHLLESAVNLSRLPPSVIATIADEHLTRHGPLHPLAVGSECPSLALTIAAAQAGTRRGIIWMITSMVVILVVAAGVIPIDQVVTARGIVVSQSPTILVQPLDTAIVRSIEVREGQRVQAGEVLARLDPTFAAADLATLAAQVSSLEAEVSRLQAEADGQSFTYSGHDPAWLLQASIHAHRIAEFDSKIDNYRHRANELASVISRSQSDAVGYRERLGVAQTVEQMRKQLEVMQAGSKLQMLMATDTRAAELGGRMSEILRAAQQCDHVGLLGTGAHYGVLRRLQPWAHDPGAGAFARDGHQTRISLLRCRSSSSFDCPAAMALASDLKYPPQILSVNGSPR